jgi:hypothetical protein
MDADGDRDAIEHRFQIVWIEGGPAFLARTTAKGDIRTPDRHRCDSDA